MSTDSNLSRSSQRRQTTAVCRGPYRFVAFMCQLTSTVQYPAQELPVGCVHVHQNALEELAPRQAAHAPKLLFFVRLNQYDHAPLGLALAQELVQIGVHLREEVLAENQRRGLPLLDFVELVLESQAECVATPRER
jgi:hypothetical protein